MCMVPAYGPNVRGLTRGLQLRPAGVLSALSGAEPSQTEGVRRVK